MATGAKIHISINQNECSMPNWGDFGVVVNSNDKGFLLAHPRPGLLELSINQIEETYPEGMEIILVDRTNESFVKI